MSLFFLNLSFLAYFTSHYWAKKTQPERNFSFGRLSSFKGDVSDFEQKLGDWIKKQPYLTLFSKTDNEMIISERAGLFSYGYFYHIQWTKKENNIDVTFCVQPKLVSLPKDKKTIGEQFSQALELQDVS